MLLRPDQVSELLTAVETLGAPVPRLRDKLTEDPDNDAHQTELVALLAALSVGDATPEEGEEGEQAPARPDVRCLLPSGRRAVIECLHAGAKLTMRDELRPPAFIEFGQKLRAELARQGIDGESISLSYPGEASRDRVRVSPSQIAAVLSSGGFAQFVADLKSADDGTALWHLESHAFFVEACGYGTRLVPGGCPPDFRAHPVYRGIKNKMKQVSDFAEPDVPVVLFCAVTNAVSTVRSAASRGVDSRRACLAAFGVPGEGEMIVKLKGLVTHGRVQGSERVGAVVVLEVSPRNYLPPHRAFSIYANPFATSRLQEGDMETLLQMVMVTHHASPVDAATLHREVLLRREAIRWNARPLTDRAAERGYFEEGEDGTLPPRTTGELQRLLAKGHRLDWDECLLHVWPWGRVVPRDPRRRG